jgi:predicted translin family RNA/ssDNA-binding protein
MDALKDRMNEFDRQREVVIKKTRDIQKYSKQAVFSFHGKRFSEGKGKLQAAKKIADEIKLIIAEVCFLFEHYHFSYLIS